MNARLAAALLLALVSGAHAACMPFPGMPQGISHMTCAGPGEFCGANADNTSYAQCISAKDSNINCDDKSHMCVDPVSLDSVYNQTCTTNPTTGADSCQSDDTDFFDLSCQAGHCRFSYAPPGHVCTNNDECAAGKCMNNMCAGHKEGEACQYNSCDRGLHCTMNETTFRQTCLPQLPEGSSCTPADACVDGTACTASYGSQKPGTCVKYLSLENGAFTADAALCKSGYMERPTLSSYNGTCGTAPSVTNIGDKCTGPSDTPKGTFCVCPLGGQPTGDGVVMPFFGFGVKPDVFNDFLQCALQSECAMPTGMWQYPSPGSCLYYRCSTSFTATKCTGQVGMFTSKLLAGLKYPECAVDVADAVFDTMAHCETYERSCETLPGGIGGPCV